MVDVEDEDEDVELRLAQIRSLGGEQEEPRASVPEPGESWDGIAYAGYHQFYIGHAEDELDYPDECVTNLIEPLPNGACIVLTGIHTGGVRYSVQCHESAPAAISDEWEDTATVTVEWRRTPVHVIGWAAESMDDHDLAFRGPGWYSIRCSARGRALEVDLGVTTAQEMFRLAIWPADGPAAPAEVRLTSGADF